MAESLSGSDLDEVIKHPPVYDSSSSSSAPNHPGDTIHDTKRPPMSVLKDVVPSKKKPSKEKAPTTKRPHHTSHHRTLDYRKGKSKKENVYKIV